MNPLLLTLIALFVIYLVIISTPTENMESMPAPIQDNLCTGMSNGTFINPYPRGRCDVGSFKRQECSVGNCPLGTSVTDNEYCYSQCAQTVDATDNKLCMNDCMNMMVACH